MHVLAHRKLIVSGCHSADAAQILLQSASCFNLQLKCVSIYCVDVQFCKWPKRKSLNVLVFKNLKFINVRYLT